MDAGAAVVEQRGGLKEIKAKKKKGQKKKTKERR
jgi:hypothetical protein